MISLAGRYRRLLHAMCSGAAARVITSSVTLISLPLVVRFLGPERYGVWATVTTTAVWINLLDLGVANTLTNHISESYARGDKNAAARWFTNALLLTTGAALIAALAGVAVFSRVNWVALFNVSSAVSRREVEATVGVAVGLVLLGIPCNLAGKLLAGYQELHRYNYAMCAGALASLAGLAIGVALRVSMPALFVMSLGCMTYASAAALLMVIRRKAWLIPRASLVSLDCIKELLNSGSSFLLIQIAAIVVFSSDNLVVSHYLGAAEVTPYSVTWRLAACAALLQSLLFPALWPAYSEAYAKGEYQWIRRTFSLSLRTIMALNSICALAMVVLGRSAIRVWAGASAVPTQSLIWAMAAWIVLGGFMTMESCLLAALNRTRAQAVLSIVAAVANIALSILLVRRVGAVGVIGGTILSYAIVLVVPQTLIVRGVWRRELTGQRAEEKPREQPIPLITSY